VTLATAQCYKTHIL